MVQLRTAGLVASLVSVLAVSAAGAAPRYLPHSRPGGPTAVPGAIVVALPPGESFTTGSGGAPIAGFETYGEIALDVGDMSGFHNTTSVVLAFPK